MLQLRKIERELLAVIKEDFKGVKVLEVKVAPDVDFDGDDILQVKVVFDGKAGDIDGVKLAQAIRKIRPVLRRLDTFEFPSLSFMTREDAEIQVSA